LGAEIATTWAKEHGFPLENKTDLAKVAQYIAINVDATRPKELILERLENVQKGFNFNDEKEPLNVLAQLPLPVYITTNYDDLLYDAISHHGRPTDRVPAREICKWNNSKNLQPVLFRKGSKFQPTRTTPVVYHLHGHKSVVDSIVLTEDDYLDFLVNMSKDINEFLPVRIQAAITGSSVLFVGYSLADIDFCVIFRGLRGNLDASLDKMSIAVQLPYDDANPDKKKAEEYVTRYFGNIKVKVYWGTASQFTSELWERWKVFPGR
jgi:hypothetical protein